MKMKMNPFEILFWAVVLILFYMILIRVFGHSATDIQIYLGFLTSLLVVAGFLLSTNKEVSKLNREVGEIKVGMKHGFNNVKRDIKMLNESLNRMENKIDGLK